MSQKLPRLDLAVLCSNIVWDADQRVFALEEPLHTVTIPPSEDSTFKFGGCYLFVQMATEDAHGRFRFYLQFRANNIIVEELDNNAIEELFFSRYYPILPYEHVFEIPPESLSLPQPGEYNIHIMCNHVSLCDLTGSARTPVLRIVAEERGMS